MTKYFNLIHEGKKTVELRLYNNKCQQIKIGDKIEFINNGYSFIKIS